LHHKSGKISAKMQLKTSLSESLKSVALPTYADANGNITEYVNIQGSTVAYYEYSPFGQVTSQSGSEANNFNIRFSSKYCDLETNLGYWGYRYYHPEEGRWLGPDLVGENGGLLLYGYCGNDGVNWIDVNGMYPNQAEAAGLSDYLQWIKTYYGQGSTIGDALNEADFIHQQEHSLQNNAKSYLYSSKTWWIDMKHFSSAAKNAFNKHCKDKNTPDEAMKSVLLMGKIVEWQQTYQAGRTYLDPKTVFNPIQDAGQWIVEKTRRWIGWKQTPKNPHGPEMFYFMMHAYWQATSAWNAEDPTSNMLGAYFGAKVLDCCDTPETGYAKLQQYLESLGVGPKPAVTDDAMKSLPANQQEFLKKWISNPFKWTEDQNPIHGIPDDEREKYIRNLLQ